MPCVFFLLCVLLPSDDALTLGAGQSWYDGDKTMPQQVEGILDYQSAGGRVGVPANFRPFRVMRQDAVTGKVLVYPVYAPGHEATIALNVGQRVRLEAKIVASGEGEARQEELWIGKLTPLGAAPLNAFSEIKAIAHTNRFQPQRIRQSAETTTLVIRSAKEAAQQLGQPEGIDGERIATQHLAALFGVKDIDWKNQMIVYVGLVHNTRTFTSKKIEITKLDVNDRGVVVAWKEEPTPQVRSPYISDAVVVPRVDGEVTFKKEASKEGSKEGEAAPEKEARGVRRPVATRAVIPEKR